ncbi:MAG TPA: proton-conducting transporter membrane subunit, partial [Candidatus Methylomirabilis sp.]|nr:proton-conducting transporter membrane subunit [Candidatus Methylomirabilis sp.]
MPQAARIILIPLAPLLGSVVLVLGGRLIGKRAHRVAVTASGFALVGALSIVPAVVRGETLAFTLYNWMLIDPYRVSVTLWVDQLTLVMLLLVTGVGFLIHVYSIGYMHGDPGYARYFAYLNLFVFSMVMLVLAGNYLVLYIFWEAVGLCSYLLIGFWHERRPAAEA